MAYHLPPAVCARAKLLSSVHPERTVSELTGVSRSTIYHLKKRGWRAVPTTCRQRQRPTDFAIQVRYMNRAELVAHYHTSNSIVARWGRELRNGVPVQ